MSGLSEGDREKVSLFVEEMRAMREQRGWSQAELARETNYSESAIAMVETYQRAPTLALAKGLDKAFKTAGFTEDNADVAGTPGTPGTFMRLWRKLRTVSFPASFRSFVEHEEQATELRMFEHSLVPGLLQTEEYARATLERQPNITEEKVSELLAVRMARQAILTRKSSPSAPLIWAVLDEGVLYREVGGPKVMHDQIMSLVAASELPNVTIQILPSSAGGHQGLEGAFIIADFTGAQSIVFLDDLLGGRVIEEAEAVSEAALHFSALRSEALPKTASRERLLRRRRKMDTVNGTNRVEAATWRKASYSGSSGTNCVEVGAWRKASYSSSNGTNCVEVGLATRVVSVRDTKDRDGFVLSVEADAWERFTDSLK